MRKSITAASGFALLCALGLSAGYVLARAVPGRPAAAAPAGPAPVYTEDWVSRHAEVWPGLLGHLRGVPGARGLEIGSFEGRSAVWFCKHVLTGRGASLACVDPFLDRPGLRGRFDHNVRAEGVSDRVAVWPGKSQDVLRTLPRGESFDFIYVDGCHEPSCALADAVLSFDLLKPGGILMFDDYTYKAPGPGKTGIDDAKPAVDAFLACYRGSYELVHKGDLVAVKKTGEAY